MNHVYLGIASILLVFTLSCQNDTTDPERNLPFPETKESLENRQSSSIQITDDQNQIIPNARVLIGLNASPESPWIGTDEAGLVEIPKSWTTPQDLTIEAQGFVRLTLKLQNPVGITVTLRKKPQIPQMSVKGTATGIPTKDKDGFVDFAILLDSLTKKDILNFNINKVISPWTEKISVAGFEFPIPQNIFLPKQKESYFLPVTLQKPWFNLFYDSYGKKSLYSLRGKFPLKKMLSELQNKKPYYELINHFEMSSAGRLDHELTTTSLNPEVNSAQIVLDKTFTVKAPQVDDTQVILGISCFKEKNFYQPLDIKYMQSGQTITFKTSQPTAPYFIGVLKNKMEFSGDSAAAERMSVNIGAAQSMMNYLPLMKEPIWITPTELQADLPSMIDSGFSEQGLVVVISELQNLTLPDGKILKYKLPLWEIHSPRWASTLEVPNLESLSTAPKRVEVTLLAKEADNSGQQNPVTLISDYEERVESATHLTKSALDY